MKKRILPSILSADLAKLIDEVQQLIEVGVEWIHVDVMDGHFVPNLTFGPGMVSTLKKYFPKLKLDVHLMITNAENFYLPFIEAGADALTVHVEAVTHLHRLIHQIKNHSIMGGIVLNPATPVEWTFPVLNDVDLVLVMSVNPGFPAQKFIPHVLSKIEILDHIKKEKELNFIIEIDGGINEETIQLARDAGTDWFVAGNAIFANSERIKENYQNLKKRLQ